MNLLSSNDRFATGGDTHSSMGVPFVPNPLNRSSVKRIKSVVGASAMVWEPETEFGSVARKASAPTAKSITTTSFSDFIKFPPVTWAKRGPIEERVVLLEAGLISEERYLHRGLRTTTC